MFIRDAVFRILILSWRIVKPNFLLGSSINVLLYTGDTVYNKVGRAGVFVFNLHAVLYVTRLLSVLQAFLLHLERCLLNFSRSRLALQLRISYNLELCSSFVIAKWLILLSLKLCYNHCSLQCIFEVERVVKLLLWNPETNTASVQCCILQHKLSKAFLL